MSNSSSKRSRQDDDQDSWLERKVAEAKAVREEMKELRASLERKIEDEKRNRPDLGRIEGKQRLSFIEAYRLLKPLVQIGDVAGVKATLRDSEYHSDMAGALCGECLDARQLECLAAIVGFCTERGPPGAASRVLVDSLDSATLHRIAMPEIIHWLMVKGKSLGGDAGFPLPSFDWKIALKEIKHEENGLALLTWVKPELDQVGPELGGRPFFKWRLFHPWSAGALSQFSVGIQHAPLQSVLDVICGEDEQHPLDVYRIEATEEAAPVSRFGETYWEYERKTSKWNRFGRAGDLKHRIAVHPPENLESGFASNTANFDRDVMICVAKRPSFIFFLQGMMGLRPTDARQQHVLDGSKWFPPTPEDLHDYKFDDGAIPRAPAAVLMVSMDTGAVLGYLSHVDKEYQNEDTQHLDEYSYRTDEEMKLKISEDRYRPLGIFSFDHEHKVIDPRVQLFKADVRDRAIICIINCNSIWIHFTSDENMWNRAFGAIP